MKQGYGKKIILDDVLKKKIQGQETEEMLIRTLRIKKKSGKHSQYNFAVETKTIVGSLYLDAQNEKRIRTQKIEVTILQDPHHLVFVK